MPCRPPPALAQQSDALFGPSGVSATVLLNGPPVPAALLALVPAASKGRPVVAADGAADMIRASAPHLIPSHIVGDMDSATPASVAHFRSLGTDVVVRPSLSSHDFSKAMQVAIERRRGEAAPVLVLGGQPGGGRLDQFFGNVQELCARAEQGVDVWWVSKQSVSMVLAPGRHRIAIDPTREGPMCGILPIGAPVAKVTTKGLRWNLTDQETRFGDGGLVSSSNEVVDAAVHVETSGTLLWTCDFALHGRQR